MISCVDIFALCVLHRKTFQMKFHGVLLDLEVVPFISASIIYFVLDQLTNDSPKTWIGNHDINDPVRYQ